LAGLKPFHDRYRKTPPFTTPDHFSEMGTIQPVALDSPVEEALIFDRKISESD
jgi:hypothetical protein